MRLGKATFIMVFLFAITTPVHAGVSDRVKGKILIEVEDLGQAWYVHPETGERDYLGEPEEAHTVLRDRGVGITTADLNKIPLGFHAVSGADSDGDGLANPFEEAIGSNILSADSDGDGYDDKTEVVNGYNSIGLGLLGVDLSFSQEQLGRIFLQVESRGEAWWVNPDDGKRYYLGNGEDALNVMRHFGLGITEADLYTIRVSDYSFFSEGRPLFRDMVKISQIEGIWFGLHFFYEDHGHYPLTTGPVILGREEFKTEALLDTGWALQEEVTKREYFDPGIYLREIDEDPYCLMDPLRCDEQYFYEYTSLDNGASYTLKFHLETNQINDVWEDRLPVLDPVGDAWYEFNPEGKFRIDSPEEIQRLNNWFQ